MAAAALAVGGLAAGAALGAGASPASRPPFQRVELPSTEPAEPPALLDRRPATLMLQLSGPPVGRYQAAARRHGRAMPARQKVRIRARLGAHQRALRPRIRTIGARILGQYRDAYNGIKVRATPRQAARLAGLPGVVAVRPVARVRPALAQSVPYIGTDRAWADLGRTGAGVRIGIIDTGVDYYHADLGGSGNPADFAADDGLTVGTPAFRHAKVVGGWDFVGNAYNGGSNDTPAPDPDPLDCAGHGTHVAGIAAGNGVLADGTPYAGPYDASTYATHTFRVGPGVAPRASVYAYRVFGCTGSTDLVVDAIDRAMADGVDVLNLSLSSPFGGPDDPTAVAADTAAKAGITVVAAAGNEGQNAYLVGSPGSGDRVISVASEETVPDLPGALVAGPSPPGVQALVANEAPIPDAGIAGTLRVLQSAGGIGIGCTAAEYAGVAPGEVVVTRRGGSCARTDRARLAAAAGAAAVIMFNDAEELPPLDGPVPGVDIPFLGVRASAAAGLLAADGTPAAVTGAARIANPAFAALSAFSSGGPRTADAALKPDVTAPGGAIASAGVGLGTGAVRKSGTSMAAPHVSGVAALIAEAHPDWTPAQVKAAITSTATIDPAVLRTPDPRVAGAGLVQPRRAVDAAAAAAAGDGVSSMSFGYAPLAGAASASRTLT